MLFRSERWQAGTLAVPALPDAVRARISRQTQAEALADLIRRTVGG